jgi:mono/diheme cytochrome c family protein
MSRIREKHMQSGALVSIAAMAFAAALQAQPTYSREVSRLFQAKCQQCHRNGDIAPFALDSYEAAVTWAGDIKRVVEERIMPPWKPVPGHGDFRDNFSLTEERTADDSGLDQRGDAGG